VCEKSITNSQPFVKKMKNVRSPGGGLTHTVQNISYAYALYTAVYKTQQWFLTIALTHHYHMPSSHQKSSWMKELWQYV